ncbi:hypothetical protein PMAYCL1PPCAC_10127, partial [Pristionchus mayeri]
RFLISDIWQTSLPTAQQFAAVATMAQRWDELRKRARTLENDVDVKLTQLNKMAGTRGSSLNTHDSASSSSDRQQLFTGMCEGLERVLGQLTECNDEMCSLVEGSAGAGWAANPAVTHTVRRHRDILRDYGSEFKRARENIQGQLQREFLLAGASSSSADGSCLNNRVRASDMYYKEQDHISSCDRLLDDQIAIAVSTKENLSRQALNLKGISRRMHDLAQKYPAIGSIMNKIQNKKRKDAIVMAAVVSTCLIFTLFYLMH